jgi:NitT/TauT family transport system substrate-binding protein
MRRQRLIATIALAAATRSPLRAQTPLERLRSSGPLTEDVTNVFYAIKNGLFTRARLNIELVATNSGSAATAAVVSGTYELARTSLLALFAAHLRDVPLVIVAPSVLYTTDHPYGQLQVAVDSPYKTGADLNGKTIGAPSLYDGSALMVKAWVDKNRGDWRSLKFVEIPNSALEVALVQHRIDAADIQPPQLDLSLAAGTTKTLGDGHAAIASAFYLGAYVARRDWATAHLDALRRFNRVLAQATAYVNTHPAETLPLVAELTKIDIAANLKMRRTLNATSVDPRLIQPLIDAAAKYEHIPRSFPARELLLDAPLT